MAMLGFVFLFFAILVFGSTIGLTVGIIFLTIYFISKLLGKMPEKALLTSAAICGVPSALILITFFLLTR